MSGGSTDRKKAGEVMKKVYVVKYHNDHGLILKEAYVAVAKSKEAAEKVRQKFIDKSEGFKEIVEQLKIDYRMFWSDGDEVALEKECIKDATKDIVIKKLPIDFVLGELQLKGTELWGFWR
jgi:hypothetical protein